MKEGSPKLKQRPIIKSEAIIVGKIGDGFMATRPEPTRDQQDIMQEKAHNILTRKS
jgi:hypothetical protein